MNKNNKGSALTMVIVLLIFASYIGLVILNMAYTNLQISRSYIGDRRMYRGTDYVVNLISLRLQKDIKAMQDNAKLKAKEYFNNPNNLKELNDAVGQTYLTKSGAMDKEDYDYEFNKKYNELYEEEFEASEYNKNKDVGFSQETLDKLVTNGSSKVEDMGEEYFKLSLVKGETIYYKLKEGWYENGLITCIIDTKFEYNNGITRYNESYDSDNKTNLQNKNTSTVVFKISNNNEDFNLQNYKLVNTKNDEFPIFQSQIALLSEKNIIFHNADGTNITGDVIAFGYSPTNEGAKWNDYGGIFFGSTTKIGRPYDRSESDVSTYRENIFGSDWLSNMGIDFFSSNKEAGNITINGNMATMGYVNIANNKGREIFIKGDTFARQFMLSEDSHGSKVYLGEDIEDNVSDKYKFYDEYGTRSISKDKNEVLGKGVLCVTDDLQVDSSYSKLEVRGDFYALSDRYGSVGGDDGLDLTNEKRISTLNINGNSIVELRSKTYIGGTSVLANIIDSDGHAYTTGISGAKTSQISAEAYIYNNKNPYVYTNSDKVTPVTSSYVYNGDTISMINGYGSTTGEDWWLPYRAVHFKKYFDENVLNNFGLMGTMNFSNLRVKTDANGNINGWAQGVVVAAGIKDFSNILGTEEVNAYYNIGNNNGNKFSEREDEVFNAVSPYSQYAMIQRYQSYMCTFLDYSEFGSLGKKIIQTSPDKSVVNYLSDSKSVINVIKNQADASSTKVYLYNNTNLNAILYYSKNQTTRLYKSGSTLYLESGGTIKAIPNNKGIIFVECDIYIHDGVEFEGVIVAKGNITVTGNVNIKRFRDYYDDHNKRADIVNELEEKDSYIRTFFGLNQYELDYDRRYGNAYQALNMKLQRINQDYVKIIKWTLE